MCIFSLFVVLFLLFFPVVTEKDRKYDQILKKMLSTSKLRVKHPFAGQNTQQINICNGRKTSVIEDFNLH